MRVRKSKEKKKKKIYVMGALMGGRRCGDESQEATFQCFMEIGDWSVEERELQPLIQIGIG